jgi:hypothetical protein
LDGIIPVIVSIIALLATLYQLHLQRVHNERSLKPLPQIGLLDRDGSLHVRIENNGVGPLIIEKLTFQKGKEEYTRIQDSLELNPKSYDHLEINPSNKKIILPGGFVDIFSKQFMGMDDAIALENHREQLSKLKFKVEGKDIYNNKVVVEKGFAWFTRHSFA